MHLNHASALILRSIFSGDILINQIPFVVITQASLMVHLKIWQQCSISLQTNVSIIFLQVNLELGKQALNTEVDPLKFVPSQLLTYSSINCCRPFFFFLMLSFAY